jgi:16S rRNA G966 N2-methylase RsmD
MPKLIEIDENYKRQLFADADINYKKLQVTDVGIYSITRKYESNVIFKTVLSVLQRNKLKVNTLTITDGTSGNGADVITFAKYFKRVNAVELDKVHCDVIKHNVEVYNFTKKVKFVCPNDYVKQAFKLKQDVIFLDPPWTGPGYKTIKKLRLYLGKQDIIELINKLMTKKKCKFLFMKCPLNVDLTDLHSYKTKIVRNRKDKPKFKLIYLCAKKYNCE